MMTPRHWRPAAALIAGLVGTACTRRALPALAALCAGGSASARVVATLDHVRGPAGPALAALQDSSFPIAFTFIAPDSASRGADSSAASCSGTRGLATFTGALPEPLRNAASADGRASWQVQQDSVLIDLNPRVRDSNVFLTLPLHGGRGHWGLSTFAGEVAGGHTDPAR
jgi:hypothetical protein